MGWRIRSGDPLLAAHLAALLRHLDVEVAVELDHGRAPEVALDLDGEPVLRTPSVDHAVEHLLWAVTRRAVEATPHLAVHAAAASSPTGAVLLPGSSGSGKSTLVARLARSGLRYVTDELAAVTPAGAVEPHAKWLSLDAASLGALGVDACGSGAKHHVPADRFGAVEDHVVPVAAVVAPRYSAGGPTVLQPLTPGEAATVLLANSFNVDRLGQRAIDIAAHVAAGRPAHVLSYGDVDQAAGVVRRLLDAG